MPPTHSKEFIQKALLKWDALKEQGYTIKEVADGLGISAVQLQKWKKREYEYFTIPGPWQEPFDGKMWSDMPGQDIFIQRCNFALFRRGLLMTVKEAATAGFKLGVVRRRGRPSKADKLAQNTVSDMGQTEGDFDVVPDNEPETPVALNKDGCTYTRP